MGWRCRRWVLLLDHLKIFLCNEMAFGIEAKFIPPRSRKQQVRDVQPEIMGRQSIMNLNSGKRSFADQEVFVEVQQLDLEIV